MSYKNKKRKNKNKKNMKELKKKKRFYKRFGFYALTIPTLSLALGVGYGYNKYNARVSAWVKEGYAISNTINKDEFRKQLPTRILSSDGKVLKELNTYAKYQVDNTNVNPLLKKGFVSVEDKRFYDHHGVDGYATLRAVVNTLMHKSTQGGSTITQQLVKNKILKNSEQTASRKVTEMVVAQEITKQFSKDEILISYLNSSYFGNGANGVGAAARVYFDKDQKDLTPREASVIIGLTNNPSLYDPFTNPKTALEKSNITLGSMYSGGVITKDQYKAALKEKINVKKGTVENSKEFTDNYAVSYSVNKTAEKLGEDDGFNFKYTFATDEEYSTYHQQYNEMMAKELSKITAGGYDIKTTINPEFQQGIEDDVNTELAGDTSINEQNNKLNLQASVSVIDNSTGEIVASVGGRGTQNDYLNRAFQSFRQPGSTEKVLLGYGPAIDKGYLLPQSLLLDSQIAELPDVLDWFGGWYNREFTAREALSQSLNAPAIRAGMMVPIEESLSNLGKMKFSQLHPNDNTYVSVIGGLTQGVSTTEQASAYAAIANKGVYREPSNVTEIQDRYKGSTIYKNTHEGTRVFKESTSYMLIDMLKTSAVGETVYVPALANNYPSSLQAAKTGSTDYYKDVWFVSTNKYYTTAIWVGHDDNTPLPDYQHTEAMSLSNKILNRIMAGKQPADFDKPENVSKVGDSITVTGPEANVTDSKELVNYGNIIKSERDKSAKDNADRIFNSDYRIVYGLSKDEEEFLETTANNEISNLTVGVENVTEDSAEGFQKAISKARSTLSKVKKRSAYNSLKAKLDAVESTFNSRWESIMLDKDKAREEELAQKIQNAQDSLSSAQKDKVSELKEKLENKKTEIESKKTISSSDISSLDSIVDELNKNGEATGYFRIITNPNNNAILIQDNAPGLK